MARAATRLVGAPGATLVRTGAGHTGYRMISGSMGAAPIVDADAVSAPAQFEPGAAGESDEEYARRVAAKEAAEGLPVTNGPTLTPSSPPLNWSRLETGSELGKYPLGDRSSADLSALPDRFSLEVERKGALWVVRALGVHVALFVSDADLVAALAAAPARLAEIIGVDGQVPAKRRRKK